MNGSTPHFEPPDFDDYPRDLSDEELAAAAPRCTDAANADAFVARHGRGFRYVVQWDAWLAWNGKCWSRTGSAVRVMRAAVLCARESYMETKGAIGALEEELRVARLKAEKEAVERLESLIKWHAYQLKWHEQSQNASRLNACVQVLRTLLQLTLDELDACPWYFNCGNGTVDLRTAERVDHTREHFITQIAGLDWDERAECPTWDNFLAKAMGGDLALVLYLQRLIGYALTAETREHVLLFFWGGGRNGKSTFLRTIQALFGEYGCAAPRDLLFQPRGGSTPHPSELARLYGKRLAVGAELGEHHRFDEAKVKDLTGGDTIACRRMNEDWWEYRPTHTLFLAGNHKPSVSGDDLGIWRRIRLIPWTVTVPEADVDSELPAKLARELPGILRWAVHGCLEWQRIGLSEPPSVVEATAAYRLESDVVGEFLRKHCAFDRGQTCLRRDLRERYERWCAESGHEPVGARKFAARLRERSVVDCTVRKGMGRGDGWRNIRLLRDDDLWAGDEPDTAEPLS
jgi:putative DNA primase/helicase